MNSSIALLICSALVALSAIAEARAAPEGESRFRPLIDFRPPGNQNGRVTSTPAPTTTTTPTTTAAPVPTTAKPFACIEEGFFTNPKGETWFFQCKRLSNGSLKLSEGQCEGGKKFDGNLADCVAP